MGSAPVHAGLRRPHPAIFLPLLDLPEARPANPGAIYAVRDHGVPEAALATLAMAFGEGASGSLN